jgi:nucleotide-binding universal stress UspA family protein
MKLLSKILFATDFGESAHAALKTVEMLATAFTADVILLHVLQPAHDVSLGSDMDKSRATKRLKTMGDEVTTQGVRTAELITDLGNPAERIIMVANDRDVNLIVIGSGEIVKGTKVQMGSTAMRLVERTDKPVWVVKKDAKPHIRRILCPVDLSDASRRALTNAIRLARSFGAALTVMTVTQTFHGAYLDASPNLGELQELVERKHKSEFHAFLGEFDFHNVEWNSVIHQGKPHEEILAKAQEMAADVVVMRSTGKTILSRILLGDVAKKVMHDIPASLLFVTSEDAIRLRLETEIDDLENYCTLGGKFLEQGFTEEAMTQFEYCIARNTMYAPAWEGLAATHSRLGHDEEALECRDRAKFIRERLWGKGVGAEAHRNHSVGGTGPKRS